MDVSAAEIVDPETSPALDKYIADLVEARKKKVWCQQQPWTLRVRIMPPAVGSLCWAQNPSQG